MQKTKKSWFQFRLRTLLIFVTLSGIFFGVVGIPWSQWRAEQAIIAPLEKNGAQVRYTYKDAPFSALISPVFGPEIHLRAETITFPAGYAPTDQELESLKGLPFLRELRFDDTQLKSNQLKYLSQLPGVNELRLARTPIIDEHVDELLKLKNLEYLDLGGAAVSYSKLAELQKKLKLRNDLIQTSVASSLWRNPTARKMAGGPDNPITWIDISPGMTPAEMTRLCEGLAYLTTLERIRLRRLTIDTPTAQALGQLKQLKILEMDQINIAPNADLSALAGMQGLQELSIENSVITGAQFQFVAELSNLKKYSGPQSLDSMRGSR